jgi:hypothetical protein
MKRYEPGKHGNPSHAETIYWAALIDYKSGVRLLRACSPRHNQKAALLVIGLAMSMDYTTNGINVVQEALDQWR